MSLNPLLTLLSAIVLVAAIPVPPNPYLNNPFFLDPSAGSHVASDTEPPPIVHPYNYYALPSHPIAGTNHHAHPYSYAPTSHPIARTDIPPFARSEFSGPTSHPIAGADFNPPFARSGFSGPTSHPIAGANNLPIAYSDFSAPTSHPRHKRKASGDQPGDQHRVPKSQRTSYGQTPSAASLQYENNGSLSPSSAFSSPGIPFSLPSDSSSGNQSPPKSFDSGSPNAPAPLPILTSQAPDKSLSSPPLSGHQSSPKSPNQSPVAPAPVPILKSQAQDKSLLPLPSHSLVPESLLVPPTLGEAASMLDNVTGANKLALLLAGRSKGLLSVLKTLKSREATMKHEAWVMGVGNATRDFLTNWTDLIFVRVTALRLGQFTDQGELRSCAIEIVRAIDYVTRAAVDRQLGDVRLARGFYQNIMERLAQYQTFLDEVSSSTISLPTQSFSSFVGGRSSPNIYPLLHH